jgi:hypothetical protein
MAVPKLQYAIGNAASTTLAVAQANSDTSCTITSDTNFAAKSGQGMVIVDESQSTEELIYSASKSGATLSTPLANRGLEGGSAQAHAINATVKGILSAGMWNDMIDSLTNVLDQTSGAVDTTKVVTLTGTQTLTNKTITPVALINTVVSYTPDVGGTSTLNLATGNIHKITMPAGNITIATSNGVAGQCFLVEITQDGGGSRTVTWFTTIKWAGGSAPTLTTTASKRDTFGFRVTGTNTYDGFIVGQNI